MAGRPAVAGRAPVVGMVGAGQLARMTAQAAIPLGVGFRVLADSASDSAALVTRDPVVGDYRSYDDVAAFAAGCDVLTFDHEHVPIAVVEKLAASGAAVRPGPQALPFVQDKMAMRRRLGALGVPAPAWAAVDGEADVTAFGTERGWPVVLKAASGGYDGKGVWLVRTPDQARDVTHRARAAGLRLYAEERVSFSRELAAVVARSATGETAAWPVVETVQRDGICHEVLAPAPGLDAGVAAGARELATRIAVELDVVGVLAVELFHVPERPGGLVVNELAMRPHNSGHWTIEGSVTSQFAQHLRAVLGWPLGDPSPVGGSTVMVNLLGGSGPDAADLPARIPAALAAEPRAAIHLYGKEVRPGRKVGHVTVVAPDMGSARSSARRVAELLRGEPA